MSFFLCCFFFHLFLLSIHFPLYVPVFNTTILSSNDTFHSQHLQTPVNPCQMPSVVIQVSEESAEAWVDEFATAGPDFQQAKAAVEVR